MAKKQNSTSRCNDRCKTTDYSAAIIWQLSSEYEIKTAKDIQDNLKALKIPIHIVLLKSSNFVGVIS